MLPLLTVFLAASEKGWFASTKDKLFDPAWNSEHATTIWPLILGVLMITGVGLPTPEDIWLTLAGFTTYKQAGDQFVWYWFLGAFGVCSTANLIGDSWAWMLGRRYGFSIRDRFKFIKRMLNEKRLRRVQGWFDNYGPWTVFLGRQVTGIRFVTFFTAGTMRMPLREFLFFDFLGCLISIPMWLTLGAFAAVYGQDWLDTASRNLGLTVAAVGLVAVVIFVLVIRSRSRARAEADDLAATPEDDPAAKAADPAEEE